MICCTFLLKIIYEGNYGRTNLEENMNATLNVHEIEQRDGIISKLKERGAQEQLLMILTGPGGCGKSTAVQLAQQYCAALCSAVAVPFDATTFSFTSTTGSSAALFGGNTIHSAAHLNKKKNIDAYREEWKLVRFLIIDEISFFKCTDMRNLNEKLKRLTGDTHLPYGGVSIVFSGDFHQLNPICNADNFLYSGLAGAMAWENTINCAIFLENSQ